MDTTNAPTKVSGASCCDDSPAASNAVDTPTHRSEASGSSLGRDWLGLLRYWLRDRRVMIGIAAVALTAGAWFNWGWLAAIGVAPLILALAPCAAMCAVGLCTMGGGKTASAKDATSRESIDHKEPPSVS